MCNILVVENNDKIRTAIQDLLSDAGYCVDTAKEAEDAIQKAKNYTYELAIVDLKLNGGLSGFEFIEKSNGSLKYIIVTGVDTHSAREKANELRVQEFIPKPYNEIELIKAVDKHVFSEREDSYIRNYTRRGIGEDVNLKDIHNKVSVLAGRIERNQEMSKELKSCMENLRTKDHDTELTITRIDTKLETALKEIEKCPVRGEDWTKIKTSVERSQTNWSLILSIVIGIITTLVNSGIVYLVVTQAIEVLNK